MPTPTTPRLDCYHVHQADGKDSDRIMPVFELSCVLKLGDVSERAADSIEYFGTKLLPLQVKVSVSLALDPPPFFFSSSFLLVCLGSDTFDPRCENVLPLLFALRCDIGAAFCGLLVLAALACSCLFRLMESLLPGCCVSLMCCTFYQRAI